MRETKSFVAFDQERGFLFDESEHEKYPLRYHALDTGEHHFKNCFGYVAEGTTSVFTNGANYILKEGMYFSLKNCSLFVKGLVIIVEVLIEGYKPMDTIGGPIEAEGRLKYIDGCTDSLLISPVKKGDPCLNFLHFPPGINQTQHTHPSHRIGIVAKGEGECLTPFGNLPLKAGMVFVIKEWDGKTFDVGLDGMKYPNGQHSFRTGKNGMDVIAFHPDSDFGAEDENHPMINRTVVDGKPIKDHKDFDKIRTN